MPKSLLNYVGINDPKAFSGYLFDTNVWIDLNGPFVDPHAQRTVEFSALLKRLSIADARIVVPSLVLCEFCNAYIKIVHASFCQSDKSVSLKEYRKTDDYCYHAETLATEVEDFLRAYIYQSSHFTAEQHIKAAQSLSKADFDLNDYLLAQQCVQEQLIFVTGDRDFSSLEVPSIVFGTRPKSR